MTRRMPTTHNIFHSSANNQLQSTMMNKFALAVCYFLAVPGASATNEAAGGVEPNGRGTDNNLRRLAPVDCSLVRCIDPQTACVDDGCSDQYCKFFTDALEPSPNNCCPTISCPQKCQGATVVNPCSAILCIVGTECRVTYQNRADCEGEAECVSV